MPGVVRRGEKETAEEEMVEEVMVVARAEVG